MQTEDLDKVLEIEKECFTHPYTRENYEYELQDNPCAYLYVLKNDENEIVGFIDYWITFESCQLTKIAVAKKYRGNHYSCDMMEFMIEKAIEEECEAILLEVRVSNKVAISLYESYDFININTRKGYYSDNNEDAYVLGKVIGGLHA